MKTKLKKIMYTAAAALFIGGVGVNIYMTLDDPFENVSSLVLAEKTDMGTEGDGNNGEGGTVGGDLTFGQKELVLCPEDEWITRTTEETIELNYDAGITVEIGGKTWTRIGKIELPGNQAKWKYSRKDVQKIRTYMRLCKDGFGLCFENLNCNPA